MMRSLPRPRAASVPPDPAPARRRPRARPAVPSGGRARARRTARRRFFRAARRPPPRGRGSSDISRTPSPTDRRTAPSVRSETRNRLRTAAAGSAASGACNGSRSSRASLSAVRKRARAAWSRSTISASRTSGGTTVTSCARRDSLLRTPGDGVSLATATMRTRRPGMTTRSRSSTVFSATTCRLPCCSPRGTGTSLTRPGRESAESPSSASPNRALAIPMSSRASSRHGTRTNGVTRSPIPAHSSCTLGAVSRNTPIAKSRGRDRKPVTALSTSTAKAIARWWVHSSLNARGPRASGLKAERVVAPRRDSGEVLVRFEIEREPRSLQESQIVLLRRELARRRPWWNPARGPRARSPRSRAARAGRAATGPTRSSPPRSHTVPSVVTAGISAANAFASARVIGVDAALSAVDLVFELDRVRHRRSRARGHPQRERLARRHDQPAVAQVRDLEPGVLRPGLVAREEPAPRPDPGGNGSDRGEDGRDRKQEGEEREAPARARDVELRLEVRRIHFRARALASQCGEIAGRERSDQRRRRPARADCRSRRARGPRPPRRRAGRGRSAPAP